MTRDEKVFLWGMALCALMGLAGYWLRGVHDQVDALAHQARATNIQSEKVVGGGE